MTEHITVAEAVGRTLAIAGVAKAFGVVGSGNFHMTNALVDSGVELVKSRHELGGACMADAYTRLTGKVSLVTVHQGGGFLNSLTGFLEAVKAHTPIILLAGDVARGDVSSNFAMDQDRAAEAIGAIPARVHSAATAIADAAQAVYTAVRERTPVLFSVPLDTQDELVEFAPEFVPAAAVLAPAGASQAAIQQLVDVLAGAQRPVVIGGWGARAAKASLRDLAEASGALLVTTAGGRGLFVGDEWALDIMGGFSTPGAAELIAGADVLVAFGAGLNRWTARLGILTEGKHIVQVDDRPAAIGFHRPVDLAIIGDAAHVAHAANTAFRKRFPQSRTGYRTAEVHARVQQARYWSQQPIDVSHTDGKVDPAELTQALDRMLPMERVVLPDGGNVNIYGGAFLRVPDEHGYVIGIASQTIGLGLAQGIGAAIARPDRLVVVGTGDGALLMNAVELDTAVRLKLGMLIVVYNDDAYGAEVHIFHDSPKLDIVRFPDTDIAAVARGYGCAGITVRSLADLEPLRVWLAGPRDRPFLIDAKIEGYASPSSSRALRRAAH